MPTSGGGSLGMWVGGQFAMVNRGKRLSPRSRRSLRPPPPPPRSWVTKRSTDSPFRAWKLVFASVLAVILSSTGLANAAKEIPITSVTAVQGGTVFMPCNINHDSDSVDLVLWYCSHIQSPIYSVDFRVGDFNNSLRWSDDRVFGTRAYFLPDRHPAALAVDKVREEDAGIYRCRVDFKAAQTRNTKVNLTVIVPPNRLQIKDQAGEEYGSVVGPYTEGATLLLYCHVYGGKPPPVVHWLRDHHILREGVHTSEPDEFGKIVSSVEIRSLRRSDLHSDLQCTAHNNNISTPLSANIHVDMNFPPVDVRILLDDDYLSARRRYDLVCQASGSRPPASIIWLLNEQRLQTSKDTLSNDGNTTTSTLSFNATKDDAGKTLTCRASNSGINNAVLEDSRILQIQYVPETRLQLGKSLNPDNIREGSDVYYDCLVNANPPIYKVEWRHNGRPLNHNVSAGVIITNQSLVLQGVSRSSAGNYTCVGFNIEGEGASNSFFLNVMFAPTCRPNQTRVHGVAKQEKANISCAVDANPGDVTFRWTFNNSAESVEVERSHIARHGTTSIVSYTPMTELDYGTLLCYATNRIGYQRVPCVYHIIPAGRPDTVSNCSVANMSMTSFSVWCSSGFDGGLPQSFLLEVRESLSQKIRANLTSPQPRFQVERLEPGANYQACVYSVNTKGRSEPVVVQASTIRPAEKQLHPDKGPQRSGFRMTPMTSVLVGGVCAVLVVAAVVGAVVRLRCCTRADKRRPKDSQEDDKGSLPGAGSPHSGKLGDSSGGDGTTDSDEKNPDIIPQPSGGVVVLPEEQNDHSDLIRRRQHVSVIETTAVTSPTRTLLQNTQPGYPGYCTLRNGMPLQDLGHCQPGPPKPKMKPVYSSTGCPTLPRQHWASFGVRHPMMAQSMPFPAPSPATLLLRHPHHQQGPYMGLSPSPPPPVIHQHPQQTQTLPRPHHHGVHHHGAHLVQPVTAGHALPHGPSSDEDQASVDTPLMISKRESTV